MPHVRLVLGALTLLVASCGGGSGASTDEGTGAEGTGGDDLASAEATAAAETNLPSLEASADFTAVEVLDVGDGSVTTLRDAVTGDRPVLVWFWAPH